jgi:hypothetical protein
MERELTLDETVTLLKDQNAKARGHHALTAEVPELRCVNGDIDRAALLVEANVKGRAQA